MSDDIDNEQDDTTRLPLIICGRELGIYGGWDLIGTMIFCFYFFEPNTSSLSSSLPAGDLLVDFEKGDFVVQDSDGEELCRGDLIQILSNFPRKTP